MSHLRSSLRHPRNPGGHVADGRLGIAWTLAALAGVAGLAGPSTATAEAPSLQLSASVDYSSGHYGHRRNTEAIVEPLTAKLIFGDWTFRGTLPFASIRGTGDVTVLADQFGSEAQDTQAEEQTEGSGPTPNPSTYRSGLSDMSFAVSRQFDHVLDRALYLETTARVRVPTGSAVHGLGVGDTDVFLDGEFGGDWTAGGAYVGLGRRFLGAVPLVDRRDGWQGSAGGWLNASPRAQIGAFFDWRESSLAGVSPYEAMEAYVAYRISPKLKVEVFAGTGLTSNSPAFDAGLTFIFRPRARGRRPR